MWDARKLFRLAVTAVFLVFVLPLITEWIIELARENGFFDDPTEQIDGAVMWTGALIENSWFYVGLLLATGATGALWADYLIRRIQATRLSNDDQLIKLSSDCLKVSSNIKVLLHNHPVSNKFPYENVFPNILSVLLSLSKQDIPIPNVSRKPTRAGYINLSYYFLMMFELLKDGHLLDAKAMAGKIAREVEAKLGEPL